MLTLSMIVCGCMGLSVVLIIVMFCLDGMYKDCPGCRFYHLLAYRCLLTVLCVSIICCALLAVGGLWYVLAHLFDLVFYDL